MAGAVVERWLHGRHTVNVRGNSYRMRAQQDLLRGSRRDEDADRVWDSEISYYGQGHVNQVHHLLGAILEDRPLRYGGEDGVRAVRCTLATIRSAEKGRPIQVSEVDEDFTAYGESEV